MTVALWSVAACGLLALANWRVAHDLLYPPLLLSAVWLLALAPYALDEASIRRLAPATGLLLVAGCAAFSIGSLAATFGPWGKAGRPGPPDGVPTETTKRSLWLVVVALLGLPLFVQKAYQLGMGGITDSLMANLRAAMTSEDEADPMGVLSYGVTFSILGSGLAAAGVARLGRLEQAVLFLTATVYAFFSSGRTAFLLLVVLVGGSVAMRGRLALHRVVLAAGGAFVVVFAVIGYLTGKLGAGDEFGGEALWDAISGYAVGGIAALDEFLAQSRGLRWGEGTFRTVYAVLHRLGMGPAPVPLVQEFVDVGVVTNVFTVHRQYLDDFGIPGALAAQGLFGWMHGRAFAGARAGRTPMIFAYAALLYPLVMQFFQDQYFSLLSTWVQALVLFALVSRIEAWSSAIVPGVVPAMGRGIQHGDEPSEHEATGSTSEIR